MPDLLMRSGLLPGLSGVCLIIAIWALRSSIATVYAAEDEAPDLMQTLVAGDATLNNNLNLLEPRWIRGSEGREMSFGFGVEKLIAQNLEIEIGGEWDQIWPQQRPSAGGFGNVDFGLKYLFLREGQFQFAVGPTVSLPTNTRIAGDDMQPFAGVDFLWGGRLTGLPHTGWAEYLKAIEIQGDLGYSRAVGAAADDEFHFDPVIDYSFPYLAYVDGAKVPWPTCNMANLQSVRVHRVESRTYVTRKRRGSVDISDTRHRVRNAHVPTQRGNADRFESSDLAPRTDWRCWLHSHFSR
jgi:hypothetical protein